jgi:hypothetical protein
MTHSDDRVARAYRFPAGLPAELLEGGRSFPCVAENLSRTGALLVGPMPAPSQKLVDLTLKTPVGNYEARFSGRVIRADPDPGQHGLRLAIEFMGLDDAGRDALEILIARFLEGHATPTLPELKPGVTPGDVKKALDAIPLAHRIGLAVRATAKEREVLKYDQNIPVLEGLIRNPNLLLLEARAIAGLAHLQPGTVDLLAADQRFARDDEVRIALASHPHVSLQTAEKLADDLKPPQIRVLLSRATLNPALRRKLFKKLVRG